MKNKYKILSILIAMLFVTISCDSFLEEDAKGTLTPNVFYQNEEEVALALNGLQENMYNVGQGLYNFLGTDVGVIGRFAIPGGWRPGVYDLDPGTGGIENAWERLYAGVLDANFTIGSLKASSLPDEVKGNGIAQGQFYRAFLYYYLTTQWGDVPYWRDGANLDDVALLGKTEVAVIQADMIADLDEAISSGYLSTARWNQNSARPTLWAARMLKAHFHMWQKEYALARAELIEITTKSSHALNDDYADMHRQGNESHDEIIYGLEFLYSVKNGGKSGTCHPNARGENGDANKAFKEVGVYTRSAAMTFRKSFADTYDANDLRKPYNVWNSHTLANGTVAEFEWTYMPKFMGAALPVNDPLFTEPEVIRLSSIPNRIMLISEAYLLLAEAEFMIEGSSTAALAAINKVRKRTGLLDYNSISMKDIRNERAWEFAGEGIGRKTDLIRWGLLESTVLGLPAAETAAGAPQLAIDRASDEVAKLSAGKPGQYQALPIPLGDIERSQDFGGALTQNPLWE
ncbi:RagB/SusD family nutrient uptake outer membrane protein [Polaribacter sp.]|nr:RagB/SusD family nutrient uptake outer membrane protein [Polaribacter sp.]